MRSGFTLVELLVAIMVLTIGLLALAATAGIVASYVGDGGRLTGAAHAARTVLDSLAARGCASLTSGSSSRGTIVVTWTVVADTATATVDLAVGSALRRGRRSDTYQAVVPCKRT
jgi:prepilin-type N-terminal cleavage/methylation domain-containing protein